MNSEKSFVRLPLWRGIAISAMFFGAGASTAHAQCLVEGEKVRELASVVEHEGEVFGLYNTGRKGFFDLNVVEVRNDSNQLIQVLNLSSLSPIYGSEFGAERHCQFKWQTKSLKELSSHELTLAQDIDPFFAESIRAKIDATMNTRFRSSTSSRSGGRIEPDLKEEVSPKPKWFGNSRNNVWARVVN